MKILLLLGCFETAPFHETMTHIYIQCINRHCHDEGYSCYRFKWTKIMRCVERSGDRLLSTFKCYQSDDKEGVENE